MFYCGMSINKKLRHFQTTIYFVNIIKL